MAKGVVKPVDAEAAARLINGAALEAALPKAQAALKILLSGFRA